MSGCGTCHGGDAECVECHGTNKVQQHRCPSSVIESAPTHLRIHLDLLMRSYRHYTERNALPVEGGWLDQSRSYLSAIDLIDAERSRWDGVRIAYQEKKRASEAKQARSQMPRRR